MICAFVDSHENETKIKITASYKKKISSEMGGSKKSFAEKTD